MFPLAGNKLQTYTFARQVSGISMVTGQAGSGNGADSSPQWPMTVLSLLVGASFFALWFWLLPYWLHFHVDTSGAARFRWIAVVPSVLGFAVALRCVWDFGRTGQGTPAPMVPPKKLVIVGFYRYVRNPMYLGFFIGWVGLWIVFGRATAGALAMALAVLVIVNLFVRFYEEPTLLKSFGADYEEYCRNVHRWVPRLHPWNNSQRRT